MLGVGGSKQRNEEHVVSKATRMVVNNHWVKITQLQSLLRKVGGGEQINSCWPSPLDDAFHPQTTNNSPSQLPFSPPYYSDNSCFFTRIDSKLSLCHSCLENDVALRPKMSSWITLVLR